MDLKPRVREAGLLARERPVVVLYSGGRDSTCLLDVAVRIAGPPAVTALHVNYGLRESADEDEMLCRETCERFGVVLEVRRLGRTVGEGYADAGSRASAGSAGSLASAGSAGSAGSAASSDAAPRGNVQAWAREARYGAAREVAATRGAEIAAGHTATDQVETILYRLASSPSRRALLGMRARDDSDPPLIRPLLPFTREETAGHCRARGLAWCDDPTNETLAYARGRVRHQLVPALEAVHPGAQANVLALGELLRDEAAVLDQLVDAVLAGEPGQPGQPGHPGQPGQPGHAVRLATLRAQPPALQRLIVQRLADAAVRQPAAGVARRTDEIVQMPATGTAALDLPRGVRATVRAGVLTFAPTPKMDT